MTSEVPPTPPTTEPTAAPSGPTTGPTGATPSGPPPPGAAPSGQNPSGQNPSGPNPSGSNPSGSFRYTADDFFDRVRGLGVMRPSEGRWVAGVATGLSRRWDIDEVLVRGIFVALSLLGGIGVAAYGLAWLLFPQEDGRIHLQQAFRGDITAGFVGAVILALTAIGGGSGNWHGGYWFGWGFPGGLVLTVLIVFGIWWFARRQASQAGPAAQAGPAGGAPATSPGGPTYPPSYPPSYPPTHSAPWAAANAPTYPSAEPSYGTPQPGGPIGDPGTGDRYQRLSEESRLRAAATRTAVSRRAATAPSRPVVRATLGVALIAAALVFVIGGLNDWSAPVALVALATALGVVAAGVIISGLIGRRAAGLVGIGILLAIATLIAAGVNNAGVRSGQNVAAVGEQSWTPTTRAAAERQFNLGVGEATLWLTDPAILPGGEVAVRARLGAGHLVVVLPDGVAARVRWQLGAGEVVYPDGTTHEVQGPRSSNSEQTLTVGPAGAPQIVLNVEQGVGQLEIKTASQTTTTPTTPTPTTSPTATPTTGPTATATN